MSILRVCVEFGTVTQFSWNSTKKSILIFVGDRKKIPWISIFEGCPIAALATSRELFSHSIKKTPPCYSSLLYCHTGVYCFPRLVVAYGSYTFSVIFLYPRACLVLSLGSNCLDGQLPGPCLCTIWLQPWNLACSRQQIPQPGRRYRAPGSSTLAWANGSTCGLLITWFHRLFFS